ncbi:EAL domain-containing protein [Undibacterium sp.]|jgi:diguanylate cyclase (GGDEF)-like protein/PAS domain S-box-containing protein|uniref:EAL domain-containing protein n=1 Tax=Undibacterium sp. TaxID=1914977 RepID=UPI002BF40CE8|nr:EAL domain-containing protein [Undibacterium sp.]HTD03993.1 EAL domain-containing protein [Undibacterium sp.]
MQTLNRKRFTQRATVIYLCFGILWIMLSDLLLESLADMYSIALFSNAKGLVFILITAAMFYLALHHMPDSRCDERRLDSAMPEFPSMAVWPRSAGYLFAFAMTVAVLWARSLLCELFDSRPLVIMLMLPIIVSAAVGGLGPGLLATAVAVLGTTVLVIPPMQPPAGMPSYVWIATIALAVSGVLASALSESMHRSMFKLRASRRMQAITVDCIAEAVVTTDIRGCINYLNPHAAQMTGWSCGQAAGMQLDQACRLFMRGAGKEPLDVLQIILKHDGTEMSADAMLLHRSGTEMYIRLTGAPMRSDDGEVVGAVLLLRDETNACLAQQALAAEVEKNRAYLQHAGDAVWVASEDMTLRFANPSACRLTGYAQQEQLGKPFDFLLSDAALAELPNHFAELRNGAIERRDWALKHKDGTLFCAELTTQVLDNGDFLCVGHDVTERKRTELALRQAATVFESTHEGVLITDDKARIVAVNKAFCALTGYEGSEVLGNNPSMLSSGRTVEADYRAMWTSVREQGHWQGELWNRRKNGEVFPELLSISAVTDTSGRVTNYVGVFADISKLKASEERLAFLAHHDPLTQLPNRLMLFANLEHAMAERRRDGAKLALLMLDLDRFKDINDSFGHVVGDELLQKVGARLLHRIRRSDFLARLGGDEFAIILDKLARPEDAARVAQEIICTLAEPFHLGGAIEVRAASSIGISLFPDHGSTAEMLLQQADAAMYRAKAEGRGGYHYFSEGLTCAARDRLDLDNRLRYALRQNALRVHYQPQTDLYSGSIIGAEALVRWQDPIEGLISPARFIPVAEETGLIREIGEWVLRETCRQGRAWLDAGLPPLVLAVNVSAHQLKQPGFCELVERILRETGFPAAQLELELTESALMEHREQVVPLMDCLRARDIRLAIDDFGTGYSSLAYLQRFPLDVLKIDKSFVDEIGTGSGARAIVNAIISMGHSLGFKVLAEGVESAEQLAYLQAQGCDIYQGYYCSKPLPAERFSEFLKQESGRFPIAVHGLSAGVPLTPA